MNSTGMGIAKIALLTVIIQISCSNYSTTTENIKGNNSPDGGTSDPKDDAQSDDGSEPDESFFDDIADDYVTFEFRGLINPYSALEENNITLGTGDVVAVLGGEEQSFDSLQYALSFESGPIFPADNYEEGDIFIRCASESVSTKEFSATWENIRIGISLRELLGIGENTTEMPMSSKNRVEYISTQYNLRADGVHLIKTCLKAQADLDNDNSRLFIDTKRNDTYVAGESIEVWGNIALTDDPAKIMNGADPICEYYILEGVSGSVETDEQTYYEEMEKQFGFDCEMDQGFFLPTGNSSAIFQFEGEIASADETAIQGSVEMKLQVDGQEYETADTEAKAIQNGDSLIFQTIGSMENKGNDRSAFNFFQLEILNNRITILDEDDHYINSDPLNGVRAALIYVEELIVETDHYAKLTPIAVNIPMQRGLFVCHDDNPSFAPGEILQLAGNIELTSDKSILILAFGALTYCEKNGLSIPCQEFEEAALLKA